MLQRIRDGASGPLAYLIVGLLAFIFGVWGIGSYFTPSSDPEVATVGNASISRSQLQNAFNQRYQQLRQSMGDDFDSDEYSPERVRKDVLDSLINQAVLSQYVQKAGYRVTQQDLVDEIQSNEQFQDENGHFSEQRYRQLLNQTGMEPADYESRLAHELMSDQVRRTLSNSSFSVAPEVESANRYFHEQRQINQLTFDSAAYMDQVQVEDDELKDYYEDHKKEFMAPPRVKLAYVELTGDATEEEDIDEQQLRQHFEDRKDELGKPARRSVDVLQINVDGDDDKARQQIQQAQDKASNGDTLEDIAGELDNAEYRRVDDQPESEWPKALGQKIFDLKRDQLSKPMRQEDTWYLARVTDETQAETPDFDDPEIQHRLKAELQDEKSAERFKKASKELEELAYQAPNDLDTLADELDLKIRHTDWITQKGEDASEGIASHDKVRDAAFSDSVLEDELNSKAIDLGEQHRVVLRVTDHEKAASKPFDEVRDQVEQHLKQHKAQELARKAARKALDKARDGKSLEKLARLPGADLEDMGFVGRNDASIAAPIREAAFAMPLPDDHDSEKPAYRLVEESDNPALVQVTDTRLDEGGQAQRQQLADQLREYGATREYGAMVEYLRDKARVDVDEDNMQ